MKPALAPRGRLVAFAAAGFLLAGALAGAAALSALGFVTLAALICAYVWFVPRAHEVFDGGIKLAWWVEPEPDAPRTVIVGRPMVLLAALRCHSRARLGVAELRAVAHPAFEVEGELRAAVVPQSEVRLCARILPRAAGAHVIHGATLELSDGLGLFRVQAYFPTPLRLHVLPRAMAAAPPPLGGTAMTHERAGRRLAKRAGMGDELREIREHAHGDPWKRIAWAATARTGQLMVRDFEMDVTWTYHLLVDASLAMRRGRPGQTALDAAIEGATALSRAAIAQGDRVALTVFAQRPIAEVRAGDGPAHLSRLVGALLDCVRPVDDDLTDVTDGELAAAVARYLRHQEGIETQLDRTPPLDDPGWSRIVTGPRGELYDLHALGRACRNLCAADVPVRAADPDAAALRRLCLVRAIDLPARPVGPAQHGAAVAEALARAALPRTARVLVLFTSLGKEPEDEPAAWSPILARSIALVRRRRHRLTVVVPVAPSGDDAIESLAARADRRRAEQAAHRLRVLGVDVKTPASDEPAALWMRRLGSVRPPRNPASVLVDVPSRLH